MDVGTASGRPTRWTALRLLLLAASLIIAALAIWALADLLLLVFGAILLAILLRGLADLITAYTPVHGRFSFLVAGVLALAVVVLFFAVIGTQLQQQMVELVERIPELIQNLESRLGADNIGGWLASQARDIFEPVGVLWGIAGYSSWLLGGIANVVLVLIAGIYLAAAPSLYRSGVLQLFPAGSRDEAAETLTTLNGALKLWLVGQLGAMILVGTLTTLGLWIIGIPSALALGFIAGLLEFVPFVGPVLSAVPALALALTLDPTTALWVAGLYLFVQQIEGYLITPLVQQRAVDLPPALTIFAIIAFGILFGPLGILFATPLTVVCFVLVKKLWVQEALGQETDIPGEPDADHHKASV